MQAAIGALGGAGLRPALQSFYRTATTYPAVQNLFWSGVATVGKSAPQYGQFAQRLAEAAARSPEALAQTHASMASAKGEAGKAYAEFMERALAEAKPDISKMNDAEFVAYLGDADPEALGPYAPNVKAALQKGNLPVVHAVLSQRDPGYRAMITAARATQSR